MNIVAEHAAQTKPSRLDAYTNWSDAASNLKNFETWLIGKTLGLSEKYEIACRNSLRHALTY